MPGHVRKYNIPEASEVTALIVVDQHEKLDNVLRCRCEYDSNGFENLDFVNLRHRMYEHLAYPLLFSYGILCSSITILEEIYKNFHRRSFILRFCLKEQVNAMFFFIMGGFSGIRM